MSQPPYPMQLPCLSSSFPMCLLFPLFILPACAFISVYATRIVPLSLSCSHYFHSTACTYKPLLSLYHSRSPAPFLLFFPGFVVSINIFLWLVHCTPLFLFYLVSPLNFALIVLFHALLICPCYLPFLFYFYFIFNITCTTLLPFPCFTYFYPNYMFNAASLMLTLHCLYHFYPSYLYPIPFAACLVLSYLTHSIVLKS